MGGLYQKYFVLKPWGTDDYAFASRAALSAYAIHIEDENPELAADCRKLLEKAVEDAESRGCHGKPEVCKHRAHRMIHGPESICASPYFLVQCVDCGVMLTRDISDWRPLTKEEERGVRR